MGNVINKTHPDVLRQAGHHQTDAGLLWVPPDFSSRIHQDRPFVTQREGIAIKRFDLHNRSGGVSSVGIGFRLQNRHWRAGQWTDATTAYTDDTIAAQDTVAVDFPLEVLDVNNDGFVILSLVPFDWVSINVITAGVDDSNPDATDRAVRYSNAAGTGWTALGANAATTDGFTSTNTVWAAAVNNFVWHRPSDWGKVVALGTIPAGYYALNVRSTTAPTLNGNGGGTGVAGVATAIEIGTLVAIEALADNGIWEMEMVDFWEPKADGVVAYFSTANAGNRVYAECETC